MGNIVEKQLARNFLCFQRPIFHGRPSRQQRLIQHDTNKTDSQRFQKSSDGEPFAREVRVDGQRLHHSDTSAGRGDGRQRLQRRPLDKNDPGGHPQQDGQGTRCRRRLPRPPEPPSEPETLRHARHKDTAEREDNTETTGGQGDAGERDQGAGQKEEEDAGEEGRQEGGEDAVGHPADVHHHLDPLQHPGAPQTRHIEPQDTTCAVGLLLLPVLHKLHD